MVNNRDAMRRNSSPSRLPAPYLKSVRLDPAKPVDAKAYPFSLPCLTAEPLHIDFTHPVTILVGPNGSGKSTILEAIAALCGFGLHGGGKNFNVGSGAAGEKTSALAAHLKAAWLPKVTSGYFVRAETLFALLDQIDELDLAPRYYGVSSMTHLSHGEAFLNLFGNKLQWGGVYLFDEPEAALSPSRQIEFLRQVRTRELARDTQFIIATHSPLLMAYPGATLLHLTKDGILERPYAATEHFRLMREFYLDPDGFLEALFCDLARE